MNRILVASAILVVLSGVAMAEGDPPLIGNYSADVLNQYNGTSLPGNAGYVSSASARHVVSHRDAHATSPLDTTDYGR